MAEQPHTKSRLGALTFGFLVLAVTLLAAFGFGWWLGLRPGERVSLEELRGAGSPLWTEEVENKTRDALEQLCEEDSP